MIYSEKKAYLKAIRKRYKRANRVQKTKILDEFCEVCGYNRKYAIQALSKSKKKKHQRPGRRCCYEPSKVLPPLKSIWLAGGQMCSKKLVSALPEWLPHYEREYGLLDDITREQLHVISAATIDRILKPVRLVHVGKGRCGTKPGRLLKNQIPIKTDNWDITKPGFVEADTVAHCGNSLSGNFAWSITLTDILTTWTENRATWNKGAAGVLKQLKNMEKSLPFKLLGFDCDNGSEFLNYHLVRYFSGKKQKVQFTRSRPYHKNDNAHVEQKNWTHVRHLFGYDRFDKEILVKLMNDLYSGSWSLYQNHFCPTMKLIEKQKINSKYYKRYDHPKTPYQRVMASEHIDEQTKVKLQALHETLNPFELKRDIQRMLDIIFSKITVTNNSRKGI